MKSQALSAPAIPVSRRDRSMGGWIYRFVVDRFLLLPIGAAVALLWANLHDESYFRFAHALAFPVNEIAMALFLALMAQDVVDALMPGGALHTWRRWSVALVAAAGGMAGSAGVFFLYVSMAHETVLTPAWPVAAAIDIAAGYYVLRAICRPTCGLIPFLVLLAAATNLAGLLVQAAWRPFTEPRPMMLVWLVAAIGLAALMKRRGVRAFWPYIAVCGSLAWVSLYMANVHPALALVPIVPFLPHEPRRGELFADPVPDDTVHRAEHWWHDAVQVVLFCFGLVNAGILWRGYDTGTWATLTAAVIGRPLGIVAATALAVALGLRLPRDVGWREVVVVALATTSGFTFALFFATGFLPPGAVLTQVKVGALLTVVGALITIGAARLLGVGRIRAHRRS